jgi:hypothetical protein
LWVYIIEIFRRLSRYLFHIAEALKAGQEAAENAKETATDAAKAAQKSAENVADQASSKYRIFVIDLFNYIFCLFRTSWKAYTTSKWCQ